ncbi:MAG: hypothetical protein LAO04_12490 [Acidobacteriia bacterium]|nr:hypothetical protein [Terriglobia bacterium]
MPDSLPAVVYHQSESGSLLWLRLDNVPVMGRMAVIARHGGMVSSYDCCYCQCAGQEVVERLLLDGIDLQGSRRSS